jgi:hypothetical protein
VVVGVGMRRGRRWSAVCVRGVLVDGEKGGWRVFWGVSAVLPPGVCELETWL